MATYTTNYKFEKPAATEFYDISIFNSNMDVVDAAIKQVDNKILTLLDVYPVGSVYISVNDINPSALFGGTWVRWGNGRVPVGVDSAQSEFDSVEKIGGEKTHTLIINEMPSHYHDLREYGARGEVTDYVLDVANKTQNTYGRSHISPAGGDQPHNNLQPYITFYMWKRVK